MKHVLDASALLAAYRAEPGAKLVNEVLRTAFMCTVNWSEVLQHARRVGLPTESLREELEHQGVTLMDFNAIDAAEAAELAGSHPALGLSLGDRACLALAKRLGGTAVTADRAWSQVKGVSVKLIR